MSDSPSRMKSINVQLTAGVIEKIDAMDASSRSDAIRRILAAILAALADGDQTPMEVAMTHARSTAPKLRRILSESGLETWSKTIVWVPENMHEMLDKAARDGGMRAADLMRGAIFGAFGIDPSSRLSREGHEIWAGVVEPEAQAG